LVVVILITPVIKLLLLKKTTVILNTIVKLEMMRVKKQLVMLKVILFLFCFLNNFRIYRFQIMPIFRRKVEVLIMSNASRLGQVERDKKCVAELGSIIQRNI